MRCKISPETLTALHESALPWWQALAVKRHTRRCIACQTALTDFSQLDTQLRALAPIPAELQQPFVQKHRRLIGASLALTALSFGIWRIFAPVTDWEDVRNELKNAKSISWTQHQIINPPTILSDPTEWFRRTINLSKAEENELPVYCTYNRSKPLEVLCKNKNNKNSISLYTNDYLTKLAPESKNIYRIIDFSRFKRLSSFRIKTVKITKATNGDLITSEIIVILADPKTCQIVYRIFYFMHENRVVSTTINTDFKYQYD
jgi:hypothetical protein